MGAPPCTKVQSSEGTNYKTLLVPRSIELEWSMVIIQQDPSIVDQSKNHLTRWPSSEKPTGVAQHRLSPTVASWMPHCDSDPPKNEGPERSGSKVACRVFSNGVVGVFQISHARSGNPGFRTPSVLKLLSESFWAMPKSGCKRRAGACNKLYPRDPSNNRPELAKHRRTRCFAGQCLAAHRWFLEKEVHAVWNCETEAAEYFNLRNFESACAKRAANIICISPSYYIITW